MTRLFVRFAGVATISDSNDDGKLGDGTNISRSVPTLVAGNLDFVAVSAGDLFTCGLTSAGAAYCWGQNFRGELYCWGQNQFGQLGDLTSISRGVPTLVAGAITFESVSAGVDHTCGRDLSGIIYCWGSNAAGQLGDGTSNNHNIPIRVVGQLAVRSTGVYDGRFEGIRRIERIAWYRRKP